MKPELPSDLSQVLRHLELAYPAEGCGLLLRKGQFWRFRPMANAYDRYHAMDPERFPRTSKTAYLFDPKEWLSVLRESEERGEEIACVFHSHVDAGSYFSSEDKAMAAPDGVPVLPGTVYLVVAVDGGNASAASLFWWDAGKFQHSPVVLPGAG
jgi:proteasome lid subunit RPN8/RPN11